MKPIKQKDNNSVSIEVIILTNTNHVYVGHYDFEVDLWVTNCGYKFEDIEIRDWHYKTK